MTMLTIEDIQGSGRRIELGKVVIKLGSAVIAGEGTPMDLATLSAVADGVKRLRDADVDVMVVSSGAIGMGRRRLPDFKPKTIPDRQALAAVGQVGLMHTYKELFNQRGFLAGQVLLTRDDMEDRRRYLNARYTLERLLELGVVPVINENDTVTIEELTFGDNDELSALVAAKMDADLLIILSITDGLYERFEGGGGEARRIEFIEKIDEDIMALAGRTRSSLGTGGMTTKLTAVRHATQAGVHAIIAGGKTPGIIESILEGRFAGTYFTPRPERRLSGRMRWIGFGRKPRGRIHIDAGACEALVVRKKSLLAAGITRVEGDFDRGDIVEVVCERDDAVARGLVNYSAGEIEKIKGLKTAQIRKLLGEASYDEVIHRDYLAMLE